MTWLLSNAWTDLFSWADYWMYRMWWPFFDWKEGMVPYIYLGCEGWPMP